MAGRVRKSSARVTLVLLGVAALSGCGRDEARRDIYASREDCLADWGNTPQDCQPASDPRHFRMGYYYGPSYMWHGGAWGAHGSRSIGSATSHTTRGGFGASGRSSGG